MAFYQIERGGASTSSLWLQPTGVAATDTANLQAALDSFRTSGTPIYLASGTFALNATLTYEYAGNIQGPVIIGAGPMKTYIMADTNFSGPLLSVSQTTGGVYAFGTRIQDVCFLGYYGSARQHGVKLLGSLHTIIENCRFENLTGNGVWVSGGGTDSTLSTELRILNCYFDTCDEWAVDAGPIGAGHVYEGSRFEHCGGGVRSKAFGMHFKGCTFAYSKLFPALKIDYRNGATSRTTMAEGCWFEGNGVGDVYAYGFNHKFVGCTHVDNLGNTTEVDCYGYQFGDDFASGTTGTGDSLSAPSSKIVTLTDSGATFPTNIRGATITISGCSNSANNGNFIVMGRTSGTVITIFNPDGVAETSSFTWSFPQGCNDCTVEADNVVVNGGGGTRCTYWDQYRLPQTSQGIHIVRPNWQVFSGANPNLVKYDINASATKYTIEDQDGDYIDTGYIYYDAGNKGSETWTPSLLNGRYQKISLNTSGATTTIAVPTETPAHGTKITYRMSGTQGSGNTVTVSFAAGYSLNTAEWRDPPHGNSIWISFFYDTTSGIWIQDGPCVKGWSASSPDNVSYLDPGDIASGSYTPDFKKTDYVRAEVTATGAFTVNAPAANPSYTGKRFWIRIINGSGGAITVSWNAIYYINANEWIDPPNGGNVLVEFIWDNASGAFIPTGIWRSWDTTKSHCMIAKDSNNQVSATLGSTPTQIVGTFGTVKKSTDWTVTSSGGRMTYTGTVTKTFRITGRVCISSSNARTIQIKASKDGGSNFVDYSISSVSLGAGYQCTIPIDTYVTMATNDYVEWFLLCTSSTSDVYTVQTFLHAYEATW